MFIKSVRLSNIRSYKDTIVEFPEGSVLLSGDIGAGKSTILIAIEFALFGIKRSELSGSALLRHGAKEGFVELSMEIDKKDVLIRRTLKRAGGNQGGTSGDIKQDAGFIIVDGAKTEATAVELKARILDILGYPKDVLTRSKDLIYRFTVYTPQEEMKTILYENGEERLDTLRKIFGIDKYKRIRENASVYIRELKAKAREYEAMTYGLDEKKKKAKDYEEALKSTKNKLTELMPKLAVIREQIKDKKEKLGKEETIIKEAKEIKSEITIIDTRLMDKFLATRQNNEEIIRLNKYVLEIKKEITDELIDPAKIVEDIKTMQKRLYDSEEKLNICNQMINEADVRIKHSEEIKAKIKKIDVCPTCEQGVEPLHKHGIEEREDRIINDFSSKRKVSEDEKRIKIKENNKIKKDIEELQKKYRNASVNAEKKKAIMDKEIRVERIIKDNAEVKREIGQMNAKKKELLEKTEMYKNAEQEYDIAKKEVDNFIIQEKELDMQRVSFETMIRESERNIKHYLEEIKEKERLKERVQKIAAIRNWLEEYFVNLMGLMERQIMVQLHQEFNDLFRDWFRILIPDETINVRMDDEFKPIIEQDGYETELMNMSGGEKTSVALAYRLSLNKVINDFISHIMTRDIIMLDEPTDGFSDEQLDKVREVLEQINAKQVIIVSHEAKIESFVDNIIRVNKIDHKSVVSG
jgi:exonuclease SbcC